MFTVVSALNCTDLLPLLKYLIDRTTALQQHIIWYPILLDYPRHLSIEAVPLAARLKAAGELEQALQDPDGQNNAHCDMIDGLRYLMANLTSRPHDAQRQMLLDEWLLFNDRWRGCDHRSIVPKLRDALDAA